MGEGVELGQSYIYIYFFLGGGGFAKLLYNVIWGGGVSKIDIFLLYNMWTAPNRRDFFPRD